MVMNCESWIWIFYRTRCPSYLVNLRLDLRSAFGERFSTDFSVLFFWPFSLSLTAVTPSVSVLWFVSGLSWGADLRSFLRRRSRESEDELRDEDEEDLRRLLWRFERFLSRDRLELELDLEDRLLRFFLVPQSLALISLPVAALAAIKTFIVRLRALAGPGGAPLAGLFNDNPLSVPIVTVHFRYR